MGRAEHPYVQNVKAVAEQGVGHGPLKKGVGYTRRAELKQVALQGQLRARAENSVGRKSPRP
jgi:hypothetical protein